MGAPKESYHQIPGSDSESTETLLENRATDINIATRRLSKCYLLFALICHVGLVFFTLAIVPTLLRRWYPCPSINALQELEQSPAGKNVGVELQYFHYDFSMGNVESKYVGEPTVGKEQAWRDLMKYENIAVSKEYMDSLNRTYQGVELPDGSGYLATMNVYHELHCIRLLYHWIYPEIFYPNLSPAEKADMVDHLNHCVEGIRSGITCRADPSIVTMRWGKLQALPLANWSMPHVCRPWDEVVAWPKNNQIERLLEKDWLNHPTLGWAFANRSRTGVAHDVNE